MEKIKEVMTPEQVAEYLQLHKDTVYRYIREGKLIASRLGRNYRITKANVVIFLLSKVFRPEAGEGSFNRTERAAEGNKEMPFEEEENNVAKVIAEIARRNDRYTGR